VSAQRVQHCQAAGWSSSPAAGHSAKSLPVGWHALLQRVRGEAGEALLTLSNPGHGRLAAEEWRR